jgi:hypothetical protein
MLHQGSGILFFSSVQNVLVTLPSRDRFFPFPFCPLFALLELFASSIDAVSFGSFGQGHTSLVLLLLKLHVVTILHACRYIQAYAVHRSRRRCDG